MASLYILIAIFLWSSLGVVVRLSGVEIHVLIFYSLIVSLIVQGVIVAQRRYRKEIPQLKKMKYPLFLGILSLLNTFAYFYAFQNTTIANAVLTHYTAPVVVALLAALFLREKITGKIVLVLVLASAGLWIMLGGFSLRGIHTAGIVAGLISGLAYAIIVIFLRVYSQDFSPLVLCFFTNIFIAIMLAPFVKDFPVTAIKSYLFMGIVHSTIAPILYFRGLQSVTANRAAVLGYLEPVCAIIFSILLLNEVPRFQSVVGGVLIIFSGYLTVKEPATRS
jgi:drug/metabolite transporter (DMT)-like permease